MNPDHFDNLKTTYTTWTLIDSDGNTVSFKVLNNGGSVTITQKSGGSFMVSREDARKHWNRYMDDGYRVHNKSTTYDMDEFHETENFYYGIRRVG